MRIIFLQTKAYRPYVEPVVAMLRHAGRAEITLMCPEEIMPKDPDLAVLRRADLVVTVHSTLKVVQQIMQALRGHVPTLTLQDGVIEYRSQKHRAQGMFRYRPLMTAYSGVIRPPVPI